MSKMSRSILPVALAFALGGGGAYWLLSGDQTPGLLRPESPTIVAQGQEIYVASCASCHGANLEGEPNWQQRRTDGTLPAPPHDETGHTWHHPDQVLIELTKYGPQRFAGADYKTAMPAYDGVLSDDDIIAVLSFIKSTWPDDIRRRHDQLNAQAQR